MRYMLYSHDGLGLGHTRRNLAISAELARLEPEASILLVTGTEQVHRLGVPPGVDILKIPGVSKTEDGRYAPRRMHLSESEVHSLRGDIIAAAVSSFRPDVFLVDKRPAGASGELMGALEILRSQGRQAALGFRDILDHPDAVRREWDMNELTNFFSRYYDALLIYGQQQVFDPIAEYAIPSPIAERTTFCGYVVNDVPPTEPVNWFRSGRPRVFATSGGGEDGFEVLQAFILASAGAPWDAVVVSGPLAKPADIKTLRHRAAESGVEFYTFLPDLASHLQYADALVCRGGYNTLVEALSRGIPTICCPRVKPRQEQQIRAEAFARRGLLSSVDPSGWNPNRIRKEIEEILVRPRAEITLRARSNLDFEGARRAAQRLSRLARSQNDYETAETTRLRS